MGSNGNGMLPWASVGRLVRFLTGTEGEGVGNSSAAAGGLLEDARLTGVLLAFFTATFWEVDLITASEMFSDFLPPSLAFKGHSVHFVV